MAFVLSLDNLMHNYADICFLFYKARVRSETFSSEYNIKLNFSDDMQYILTDGQAVSEKPCNSESLCFISSQQSSAAPSSANM
jgi:hypothetical protein